MAGRQFMNVALPATATATAIAVASYFWYKKTCAENPEDSKPLIFPVTASGVSKKAPTAPIPKSDVPPSPLPKPADSSPCDSPPLVTDVDSTNAAEVSFWADGNRDNQPAENRDYGLEYHHSEFKNDVSDGASSNYEKHLRDLDNAAAKIWAEVNESRTLPLPPIIDGVTVPIATEIRSETFPVTPEIKDETTSTAQPETTSTAQPETGTLAVAPAVDSIGETLPLVREIKDELLSITPEIPADANIKVLKADREELMADRGVTDAKIDEESATTPTPPSSQSTLVEEDKAEPKVDSELESAGDQRLPVLEDDDEAQEEGEDEEEQQEDEENGAYAMADVFQDMHLTSAPPAEKMLNLQLGDMGYNMGYYDGGLAPVVPSADASQRPSFAHVVAAQIPSAFDSANHSPSEEMLESPCVSTYSDIHSEESSDSGKGGSDIHGPTLNSSPAAQDVLVVYEFEIPQDLCGLLIGQHGSTIKHIKSTSQANVYLKKHQYNSRLKLCIISGSQNDVDKALSMIRNKFPLTKYPVVTLAQVNADAAVCNNYSLPDTMQLYLPEGIMCDVVLSSLVSAGHFFVQQPTHPTYPGLSQLYNKMMRCYSKSDSPAVPMSVQPWSICAAPVMGGWYRAMVENILSNSECRIKYLDYGGYSNVPISSLRQIRGDFLCTPFQGSECYLANVKPLNDEVGWTQEARETFERLAQGQFLQGQVIDYADNGVPFVHLHRIQGIMTMFINRELVNSGVAEWYDHDV